VKLKIGTSLFAQKFANRYSGAYIRGCDNCLSCVNGDCAETRVLSVDMVYADDGRTYCLYWLSPFKIQPNIAVNRKHRRNI